MSSNSTPRVVIVGAGFAGLNAARSLAGDRNVQVTIVDRTNHHTFQPLLYQVATGGLSPGEIAAPVRSVFRGDNNVTSLLEEVMGFDLERRVARTTEQDLSYDYLVVATGSTHAYFGHDEWEPFAPGLKTIEDALEIRRRVLLSFELAERQMLADGTTEPLNFVVVGAGPTGVELAGTLAEISRHVLAHEFRSIDPSRARIILLEGGPRVLPAYPDDLSRSAEDQLHRLGVEVRTNAMVTQVEAGVVHVGDTRIVAPVILWAAGVAASPLGRMLGVPCDRAGRVLVRPDLSIPGHPEVFVIGDLASLKDEHGKQIPGLAPVAIQEGKYVAKTIRRDLARQARKDFHYWDKGTLATIGRAAAVADFGRIHISGFIAWLSWLFIHIFFLIGFRNRLLVFIQWAWSYATYERGARLITGSNELPGWVGMHPAASPAEAKAEPLPVKRAG
jgi:NADH:ubiquinone reductase (H+-translocating)